MAQPQTRHAAAEFSARAEPRASTGAQILRVVDIADDALIVTAHSGPAEPWRVRCALPPNVRVAPGDEVVVLAAAEGPVAIACVRSPRESQQALTDGTRVHSDGVSIAVERADGTPLFRYSAESGQGRVTLSAEALNLAASAGDLCLSAAGAIRMQSRTLSFKSSMPGAEFGSRAEPGASTSALELTPRGARLSGPAVALSAQSFQLDAAEAELRGGELRSQFKRAVVALERLETTAETVVSRARNVYQSVQELWQQQAGNLRTLVAGSAQLKAREVAHRAEEAYKIRAEKIHLG